MEKLPKNLFENIALCMSGGGYRAAAFHLGAMSYLNKAHFHNKALLEQVKAISTVSGGTITGVVYALHKEKGKSFEEIYRLLISQLQTRDLIKEGLAKLKLNGVWHNNYKRRNLINSLSELYDEYFTEGESFKLLMNSASSSHLELVVFNATEFEKGINFRFQNQGVLGNSNFRMPNDVKEEIKLADIIAASSCFPGGFEPIGFPSDFQHGNSVSLNKLKATVYQNDIGLMDGGIYDNQGIDAITLAEGRNKKRYDLIIISDVSSPDMKGFRFYERDSDAGYQNINIKQLIASGKKWNQFAVMIFTIIIVAGVLLASLAGFRDNIGTGVGITLVSFACVLLSLYFFMTRRLKALLAKVGAYIQKLIPPFYYEHLAALDLADYRVGDYEPLLIDRFKALLLLLQEVFLKQIRRLNYATIYNNEHYKYRRISNLSKELTEINFEAKTKKFQSLSACPEQLKKPYQELLGTKLSKVITEAANFGTNLWFTEEDELNQILDKLIVSGQANMCFNLLVYLIDIKSSKDFTKLSETTRSEIERLEKDLILDWDKFVLDPEWMLNEM